MDVIVSELEGSWLRFVLSIPLDVVTFLTVFYVSTTISFYFFKNRGRVASGLSLVLSALIFGIYYLSLRNSLLDSVIISLLVGSSLILFLVLAPPIILARDRAKTLRILKLISVGMARRILEFVIALLFLTALSPVMILISVLIKVTTGGTILVRRPSSSHAGRSIMLYTFRTRIPYKYSYMTDVFFMSSESDWRFTKFGRFLHTSSLHLLPRLFNVLNGDLHLIGLSPLRSKLLLSTFSQELLKKEYDLVGRLYDVNEGKAFSKIVDYCIPTGVINYADLNAYELHPLRWTVVKLLDTRPRLRKEAEYFTTETFPSLRLFIMFFGKVVLRLLTALNLFRLEEVRESGRVVLNEKA